MPQFNPEQSKLAVAPVTVQPSGLACQVEVFLGPNDTTKVATSGLKSFTSTGNQQSVSVPITMPSEDGTYHVYIDLYVEGQYLAGYQATEDIEIAAEPLEIDLGSINVFVDGHPFASVSGNIATLATPIVVTGLGYDPNTHINHLANAGLVLAVRSKNLCYSPSELIGIRLYLMFQGVDVSGGPGYQISRSTSTWNCSERIFTFPFSQAGIWAQDYWHPGLYRLWGTWCYLFWDGYFTQVASFYIENFVYCTGTGQNF